MSPDKKCKVEKMISQKKFRVPSLNLTIERALSQEKIGCEKRPISKGGNNFIKFPNQKGSNIAGANSLFGTVSVDREMGVIST